MGGTRASPPGDIGATPHRSLFHRFRSLFVHAEQENSKGGLMAENSKSRRASSPAVIPLDSPPLSPSPSPTPAAERSRVPAAASDASPLPPGIASIGPIAPAAAAAANASRILYRTIDDMWIAVVGDRGILDRERYCQFHSCMFRALRTTYDESLAIERAEADFSIDCKDASAGVARPRFLSMLHHLSCRWTSGEAEAAAGFVRRLFETITYRDATGARRLLPPTAVPIGSCIPPHFRSMTARAPKLPQIRPPSRAPQPALLTPPADPNSRASRRRLSDSESLPPTPPPAGRRRTSAGDITDPPAIPPFGTHGLPSASSESHAAVSLRRYAVLNRYRVTHGAKASAELPGRIPAPESIPRIEVSPMDRPSPVSP